jgi:L-rhamnose isomerase
MALDYFDASINRISAWTVGARSWQKALLNAMLCPNEALKKLQDESNFTELMLAQEDAKMLPLGDVWNEYCKRAGVPCDCKLYEEIAEIRKNYEKILKVLKTK